MPVQELGVQHERADEILMANRAEVNVLRSRGVTDVTVYFEEHPEFVRTAAGLIEVVSVTRVRRKRPQ